MWDTIVFFLYSLLLVVSSFAQDPCNNYIELNDATRFINYTIPFGVTPECDRYISEGWYRFVDDRNMPTSAPDIGKCGTNSPIWINGNLPDSNNIATLTACKVGFFDDCGSRWDIRVKNCGVFNVFELIAFSSCEGRYCMDQALSCPEGTTSDTGFPPCTEEEREVNITINGDVYVESYIPTFDATSVDRILVFKCHFYEYENELDLQELFYDVRWDIDDSVFTVKENLSYSEILTSGKLKSTEWKDSGKMMGFNINCAIRGKLNITGTASPYIEGYRRFVGIEVYPSSLSISSGQNAYVWLWPTVPVACVDGYSCVLRIEMFDFNEQFTSGSPIFCNESIVEMTKPSFCGLEIDGWNRWSAQPLNISVPTNAARDQEYTAVVQLRSSGLDFDPLWTDYHLQPITIQVVNDNITDDFWDWHYGWCSSGTDPWISTFDWQGYGFNDGGEFVLFKHKEKPIEVHTIQRRFNSSDDWTENCALAVRAASDVFIIYGCGRPVKWIVRRLNCVTGREYLHVYKRWDSYEIHLPTGSIVGVWKALNRRLNVWVQLSRGDRDKTVGLCGTWNSNYEDDLTDRNGNIRENATLSARSWRVPKNESLFIAKQREETLNVSYMYCSCSSQTRGSLSPDVDCSWQETIPTCPQKHWDHESCQIRTKRDVNGIDDDDDDIIDVPEDIVNHKEYPEMNNDWKNGWNESSAEEACLSYYKESSAFQSCSELDNVNITTALDTCITNIRISGTTDFVADTLEAVISQCSVELRLNSTLAMEPSGSGTIYDTIFDKICPNDCKYNGNRTGYCVDGFCNCLPDFTGDDCGINMNTPPVLSGFSAELMCDVSKRGCNALSIYGSGFYSGDQFKCRARKGQISGSIILPDGTYTDRSADYRNTGEIRCSLSQGNRRRKRSSTSSSKTTVYLISVTNNGVDFSNEVPVILFDSGCTECTVTDSLVLCQEKGDVCFVGNVCYPKSSPLCQSNSNHDDASNSDNKVWIVGIVLGVIILILAVLLVLKFSTKKRLLILPQCAGKKEDVYERNEDDVVFQKAASTTDLQFESMPPFTTQYAGNVYKDEID